ncbi:FAD-dependent oxidoreductase, partial [Mailhella massiliensis]
RKRVGKDFVIEYRVNGTEGVPGGFELEESIEFVKMIEDYVDLVHVSRGTRSVLRTRVEMHPSTFMPEAPNVYMTEAMKKAGIKTPLILVGNISSPAVAERILEEGKADCIAMARALISDPEWPRKAAHGKSADIRPCIKCFNCLDEKNGRVFGGGITSFTQDVVKRYACSTNPRLGIEHVYIPPAVEKKRVCIIGGGPGGMQAAITAAERGHEVMLFEKEGQLGGQLAFSDYVSFKKPLRDFKNYLIHRVETLGIRVFFHTESTPELVAKYRPDALVAAVGAVPFIPPIPGTELPCVMSAAQACMHPEKTGQSVIVIGGGDTGCETALHLAEHGRKVLIVEMDDVLARRTGYTHRIALMDKIEREVESMTGVSCTAIQPDGICVRGPEGEQFLKAHSVVLCLGSKARRELADSFRRVAPEFWIVGDATCAKNVRQAVRQGYDAVCRL